MNHQVLRSAHSEFMYFVWIGEQTAIISLHKINWLVFVTETQTRKRKWWCIITVNCTNGTSAHTEYPKVSGCVKN
jgi:hypothetical protein